MTERSDKVIEICTKHSPGNGCNECPLKPPCASQVNDNKEAYNKRMNNAANLLGLGVTLVDKDGNRSIFDDVAE